MIQRRRGFTLLEVLIGVLVLGLALVALTRTAATQTAAFATLRERTLAGWLAQNVLSEVRVNHPFPATGSSNGTRRFGNREWRWELTIQSTDVPTIRRIDVRVFALGDPSAPLSQLTGFSGQDLVP